MLTHKEVIVTGRVQGVGFRAGARHKARRLHLTGWVQNQTDGSVRMEVEGEDLQVEAFLLWCKEGSFLAQVKDVVVNPGEVMSFTTFEIR